MSFVVLDTDVSSGSLRGRLADPLRARLTGQTWCISFVTVGELDFRDLADHDGLRVIGSTNDDRAHCARGPAGMGGHAM